VHSGGQREENRVRLRRLGGRDELGFWDEPIRLGSQFDRRGPVIEFWTVPNDWRLAAGDGRRATGD